MEINQACCLSGLCLHVLYNGALTQITANVIALVDVLRVLLDDSCADDAQSCVVVTADKWRCTVIVAVAVAVVIHVFPELYQPSSIF